MNRMQYRVWDVRRKEMVLTGLSFDYSSEYGIHNLYNRQGKQIEDYVIMQATGIVDKDNNTIWDGDILLFGRKSGYWAARKGDVQAVYYSCDKSGALVGYQLKHGMWDRGFLTAAKGRKATVVGNIYQNPELTK